MSSAAPTKCYSIFFVGVFASSLVLVFLRTVQNSFTHQVEHYEVEPIKKHRFEVRFDNPVAMAITGTVRYELDTIEGRDEWSKLVPAYGHVVHLSEEDSKSPRAYTVTMFHQLKCLDILREAYISGPNPQPPPLVRHCMNYLRQIIWCRPNTWLESAKNTSGTASRDYDTVCRDWTEVYSAAKINQEGYAAWSKPVSE